MKIIDCHTHCFPDALAPKAVERLAPVINMHPYHDGTLSSLKNLMSKSGIDTAVVCNVATNPTQQDNVNHFAATINGGNIVSLGSVHPDCPDIFAAVKGIKESGLKGIKIHTDYVQVFVNDERYGKLFEACCEYDLPIVTHAGWDPVSPKVCHCPVYMMAEIIRRYPTLKMIGAHCGGMMMEDDVMNMLVGQHVWIDLALIDRADLDKVKQIILRHDPDKILFGSDAPWGDPLKQWHMIEDLQLGAELTEKIAHLNAEKLYKI